jgi:hypothetical protein
LKRTGAVLLGLLLAGSAAHAYMKIGVEVDGRAQDLKWTRLPVRYFVSNLDAEGVSAPQLATVAQASFAAWAKVSGISLAGEFVGMTNAVPFVDDNLSVIGFQSRPELERTLGATTFGFDNVTGQLIEADIFLNSAFDWSVASAGQSGRYDVQSTLTHEIGHLFGLSHSALGETELRASGGRRVLAAQSIMFPVAFAPGSIEDRTLKADDIAGVRDLYSTARQYGQIAGRVTLQGVGLFGAHVTAMNTSTGMLVASFSLDDTGDFVIGGLDPGLYVLRAEPLDDADVGSFFDESTVVNVNFKPTYSSRLVSVSAGGAGPSVEIKVTPK